MELYDMLKNIYGKNNEEELIKSISIIKKSLSELTEERMGKVYSSYLLNELSNRHVPARLINTLDLGLNYEHIFLLVPSNDTGYFLADLTFSQFNSNREELNQLLVNGYQLVDDNTINLYLSIINRQILTTEFSTEDIFYIQELSNKKNKK